MMSDSELQTMWKEAAMTQFKLPHRKSLEGLGKAIKEVPKAIAGLLVKI
jgi:hypothetical protein